MFITRRKRITRLALNISVVFILGACSPGAEPQKGEDLNGKAETISPELLTPGANDEACDEAPETWRCAYSESLGTAVSQVCRSCADISPDDAETWKVCQSGTASSRWLNFNLSPMDCLACDGKFSSACRAEGLTECNAASCPTGCCTTDGTCVPGTSKAACGSFGRQCFTCEGSCFGGTCREEPEEEGASCNEDNNCAVGQFCVAGICQYICMPDCSGKQVGDSDGCGDLCQDCMPDCSGKQDGDSDGCGGICPAS